MRIYNFDHLNTTISCLWCEKNVQFITSKKKITQNFKFRAVSKNQNQMKIEKSLLKKK